MYGTDKNKLKKKDGELGSNRLGKKI